MEAYIGITVLGIIIIFFSFAIISGKRHAKAMKALSQAIGFSYMPSTDDDEVFLQQFSRLPLFSRGSTRDVWNIMRGRVQGFEVTIMEFRYGSNSSSTKSTRSTSTQTVIIIKSNDLDLPSFSLTPHNTSDKIATNFLSAVMPLVKKHMPQDINFHSYPLFSEFYLLQGTRKNEEAIRKLFNRDVIRYYEIHRGLCTEGAGNTIMCHVLGKELSPEDIPPLLDQTIEVCDMFQRAGDSTLTT